MKPLSTPPAAGTPKCDADFWSGVGAGEGLASQEVGRRSTPVSILDGKSLRWEARRSICTRNFQEAKLTWVSSRGDMGPRLAAPPPALGPPLWPAHPATRRLTLLEWSKDLTLATLCCTVE